MSPLRGGHPRFLRNLRESEGDFKGLSGQEMNTSYVGELEGFFECIACEDCAVNVLSQFNVEDKFPLTFNPGHSYIVHTPMKDVVFIKKNKVYVADFSDWINPEYKTT